MARPTWFRIASIVALLWNLAGLGAFISDATMGPEEVAKLSAAQQALYAARPSWAVAATGLATICGTLGCLALLLGRRWAFGLFVLSLLGLVAQDFAFGLMPGGPAALGTVAMVLQGVVLIVAVALVELARKGTLRGWLS